MLPRLFFSSVVTPSIARATLSTATTTAASPKRIATTCEFVITTHCIKQFHSFSPAQTRLDDAKERIDLDSTRY